MLPVNLCGVINEALQKITTTHIFQIFAMNYPGYPPAGGYPPAAPGKLFR